MRIFELLNQELKYFKIYLSKEQNKFYFKSKSKCIDAFNINDFKKELELCETIIYK